MRAEWGLTKPADEAVLEIQGLILGVMFEKHLGSKSRWGPYLSFLPQVRNNCYVAVSMQMQSMYISFCTTK